MTEFFYRLQDVGYFGIKLSLLDNYADGGTCMDFI